MPVVQRKANDLQSRIKALGWILSRVESVPEEWVSIAGKSSKASASCITDCSSYAVLANAWRKALKWTSGLDHALTAMLASIVSTKSVGDQLWLKVIGPASCIDGDCYIQYTIKTKEGRVVNHKGGKLSTLFKRFNGLAGDSKWLKEEVNYFVPSVTDSGVVFRNRVLAVTYTGLKQVYRVVTKCGKIVLATIDHEFLRADGRYSSLSDLRIGDCLQVTNGKTQRKEKQKGIGSAYRKELLVKYHPSQHLKRIGIFVYYRIRYYRALYEARKNGMSYAKYLWTLNHKPRKEINKLWTIPEGFDVHHVDENVHNNSPSNLVLVGPKEHGRIHSAKHKNYLNIMADSSPIVEISLVGRRPVYDLVCEEPYRNFSANGIFVHNCGKSTLCEALSTCTEYTVAKSTIRGFHSGFTGPGQEDNSLIPVIKDKTLITKDGDTLLQSPNLGQILSEARDLYDSTSRTHYRNAVSRDYEGIRMTWLLCGTSSLRQIDASELGERFLDCVIMEGIDDDMEDEIIWRVANRAARNVSIEADGKMETRYEPELANAMQLTGGYVKWLRENAFEGLAKMEIREEALKQCAKLGKFVAFMRARPSQRQEETSEREFAARLVSQLTRLAMCLAFVFNKPSVDSAVMERVKRVAMDTSRGRTLAIVEYLQGKGPEGSLMSPLANSVNETEDNTRTLLRFLRKIGVTEFFEPSAIKGVKQRGRWRLTERLSKLYLLVK